MNKLLTMMMEQLAVVNLVAFDPGETTGVFEYRGPEDWTSYTLSRMEVIETLREGTAWIGADIWVIEEFRVYPHMAMQLVMDEVLAVRVIGCLEYVALDRGIPIKFQSANNAKDRVTDEMLNRVGWTPMLPNRHCKDAARHGLFHLITTTFNQSDPRVANARPRQ